MNRIEQVATQAPAQQQQPPQPLVPRALADVRRPDAHAQRQRGGSSARGGRRGASGLAVAIASLAVPLLPNPAFGDASPTGAGPAKTEAPHTRHHLHPGQVPPGPGAVTIQGWTAAGWTLTVPDRPIDAALWGHILTMRQDGGYVPWLGEPIRPIDHPRPVVLPDGTHGEIAAYRVTHTSPHADGPDAPGPQVPADPAGPDGSTSSGELGGAPAEWSSGGPSALRAAHTARARVVPGPLIPTGMPANTKQMVVPSKQDADIPDAAVNRSPAQVRAVTAADVPGSGCLSPGHHPVGKDHRMRVHLRPAVDAMAVVVTRHRPACAVRVDYLSQARA